MTESDEDEVRINGTHYEILARFVLNGADIAWLLGSFLKKISADPGGAESVEQALDEMYTEIAEWLMEVNDEQAVDHDLLKVSIIQMMLAGYKGIKVEPPSS